MKSKGTRVIVSSEHLLSLRECFLVESKKLSNFSYLIVKGVRGSSTLSVSFFERLFALEPKDILRHPRARKQNVEQILSLVSKLKQSIGIHENESEVSPSENQTVSMPSTENESDIEGNKVIGVSTDNGSVAHNSCFVLSPKFSKLSRRTRNSIEKYIVKNSLNEELFLERIVSPTFSPFGIDGIGMRGYLELWEFAVTQIKQQKVETSEQSNEGVFLNGFIKVNGAIREIQKKEDVEGVLKEIEKLEKTSL